MLATAILVLMARSEEDVATCDSQMAPAEEAGSQLLQKSFRNEGKSALAEAHYHSQNPVCTGVVAQGRCWYLGEQGETCTETCAKNGFGFSFVVADPENPVTPTLVGHEPAAKQEAWAALECYVASEDRYHIANANAAKHIAKDIGSWRHDNCKLACPCGNVAETNNNDECGWKRPAECAAEYLYKGTTYRGCATVDSEHGRPWCQHNYIHTEGDMNDWSFCEYSCGTPTASPLPPTQAPPAPPAPGINTDRCVWLPASSCVQEFDYQGAHYMGCSSADHDTPWCSNTVTYAGSWNHCVYTCPNGENTDQQNQEAVEDDQLCAWELAPECARAFNYKGVDYSDCVTKDNPTPWCSYDRIHKGSWTTCQRVCTSASVPATTLPRTTPQPQIETPCTRHPEVENDEVGNSVTLDQAGYSVAASAESPINMKRFVCRVVDKIGCRVTDLPSLMAFVPYYNGLVSHQTYRFLENELITICHTGGKWVQPQPQQYVPR